MINRNILQAYWAWSWDELVEYELPAIVGFVHSQTGQKMHYVGHSLVRFFFIFFFFFMCEHFFVMLGGIYHWMVIMTYMMEMIF